MIATSLLEKDFKIAVQLEAFSNPFAWKQKGLTLTLKANQNLAVYIDQNLVGFLTYRTVLDECEIIHIVTHAKYRQKGIATCLLKQLFKQLRTDGIEVIFLEVRQDNLAALSIYQKNDFQPVGIRKKYYQNKFDAIMMRKILV